MTAEFQLEKGADGVSTCITKEISCPNCGAVNKMDLWPGIDRKEKPLLRKNFLICSIVVTPICCIVYALLLGLVWDSRADFMHSFI